MTRQKHEWNDPDDPPSFPHSPTGSYRIAELVPTEALDLTMEQLLALVASKIVSQPDDMEIHVANSGRIKVVEFDIHPNDRAQFLGGAGRTIQALRTVSKAILGPLTKRYRYNVEMTHDDAARRRR